MGAPFRADHVGSLLRPKALHEARAQAKSGKISKEEFMAYHEKMWASMKKDASGMVDAKSMMMHHDGMMKDKAMSGGKMSGDKMSTDKTSH